MTVYEYVRNWCNHTIRMPVPVRSRSTTDTVDETIVSVINTATPMDATDVVTDHGVATSVNGTDVVIYMRNTQNKYIYIYIYIMYV